MPTGLWENEAGQSSWRREIRIACRAYEGGVVQCEYTLKPHSQ